MSDQKGKDKGARILVIDDEEILHVSLRRTLGRQGHDVDAVLSGPEGLQLLQSKEYDLVISLLHGDVGVEDPGKKIRLTGQLVIVGGEHCLGFPFLLPVKVFHHGPGQAEDCGNGTPLLTYQGCN